MNVLNKRYDPAVPVDQIKPNPRNVNEGDLGQLSVSISENGFYGALIVNERTGYLVAGEHRWRSAIGEGATTLPVLFIDCDAEHERKILLADNRTARLGCFNNYALAEELQAIQSDYGSLLGTGFDDDAMAELINDLTKPLLFDNGQETGKPSGSDPDNSDRVPGQTFEAPNATVRDANSTEQSPDAEKAEKPQKVSLAERFGVPPFSVLDARQGYWQDRKRAWLSIGIKSELGRGGGDHDCIPGGGGGGAWGHSGPSAKYAKQASKQARVTPLPEDPHGQPATTAPNSEATGQASHSKMALHNDPMQRKNKYDN